MMSFERSGEPQFNPEASEPTKQPEEMVSFGNERFAKYAPAVAKLIPQIAQAPISGSYYGDRNDAPPMQGEIDATFFEVRLSKVAPNQGFVGLVELQRENEKFDCVIKREQDNTRKILAEYVDNLSRRPGIKDFVPEPYARSGDWVVMERLYGIEGSAVQDRLANDPTFMEQYVKATAETIQELARQGLALQDVKFADGHNVMVNPTNGDVKFIEFGNVRPDKLGQQFHELVTKSLLGELNQASSTKRDEAFEYTFRLCQQILKETNPDDLYIRPRVIKPTHPDFKRAYDVYHKIELGKFDEELTPERHREILDNPLAREKMTMPVDGQGYDTLVVSPDIIQSVQQEDKEKFTELLRSGKYLTKTTKKTDSRYEAVVLSN